MWPSHTFLTDIKLYVTAAMRTAVSTHVAEILRDAGVKVTPHILSGTPQHDGYVSSGFTRTGNREADRSSSWEAWFVSI